ncbi:unnamed protein product [Camellia sinensis]
MEKLFQFVLSKVVMLVLLIVTMFTAIAPVLATRTGPDAAPVVATRAGLDAAPVVATTTRPNATVGFARF